MHYCCLVISREFPTDRVLDKALAPFSEDEFFKSETAYRPVFMWDYWLVGGRYSGQIKLKAASEEDWGEYEWNYLLPTPRAGRLFRSMLLETMHYLAEKAHREYEYQEEEFFRSMGKRDGFLYVDGCPVRDIVNLTDIGCFCFVDADGNAAARSFFDGENWVKDDTFEDRLKELLASSGDYYACIVDLHD
jgi:hypothetical protein